MAYKKEITLEGTGITLPEAYIRAENISLDTVNNFISCSFVMYKDEEARKDRKLNLGNYHTMYIPYDNTIEIVKQIYLYINEQLEKEDGNRQIKTKFEGAESV